MAKFEVVVRDFADPAGSPRKPEVVEANIVKESGAFIQFLTAGDVIALFPSHAVYAVRRTA